MICSLYEYNYVFSLSDASINLYECKYINRINVNINFLETKATYEKILARIFNSLIHAEVHSVSSVIFRYGNWPCYECERSPYHRTKYCVIIVNLTNRLLYLYFKYIHHRVIKTFPCSLPYFTKVRSGFSNTSHYYQKLRRATLMIYRFIHSRKSSANNANHEFVVSYFVYNSSISILYCTVTRTLFITSQVWILWHSYRKWVLTFDCHGCVGTVLLLQSLVE